MNFYNFSLRAENNFTIKKMKTIRIAAVAMALFTSLPVFAQQPSSTVTSKTKAMKQIFIDKFVLPENAKTEFLQRMNYNRTFLKKQPGFISDAAYERTDEDGNLVIVTVAIWENEDAIAKAKAAVQAEYKRIGFNMPAMLERLKITIERATYHEIGE
jgi:heme-degrading monooxygenase HmoA